MQYLLNNKVNDMRYLQKQLLYCVPEHLLSKKVSTKEQQSGAIKLDRIFTTIFFNIIITNPILDSNSDLQT